jgi:hypothetical protein
VEGIRAGRDTPLALCTPLLATIAVRVSTVMGFSSHHSVTTCSSLHACEFGDFSSAVEISDSGTCILTKPAWLTVKKSWLKAETGISFFSHSRQPGVNKRLTRQINTPT